MTVRHRALILVGVMAAAVLAAAPVVTAQAVTVTGVSPSSAAQGTSSLNVTISGKNFKAGATVAFYRTGTTDTGGVVVNQTTHKRAAQLIANITVEDNATIGSYDVVVQVGASLGTGVALFRVTAKAIDPCAPALPAATADSSYSRDETFGNAGVVIGPKFMEVAAVTTDAEDRIVAVGSSWNRCAGTAREWTIVRYLANGELDLSFGYLGVATKKFDRGDGALYAVAIDGSGRIIVGGYRHMSSSANYGVVARYSAYGTLDTTFAPDGLEPGIRSLSLERYMTEAQAIAIQNDGKIVIAGMDGGVMALFRLTENGGWDTAGFNAGAVRPQLPGRYVYVAAPGAAYGVALQGTGLQQRIIVAGRQGVSRSDQTYDYDGAVWGFTAGGVPDSTFGTSGMVTTGFAHVDDDFRAVAIDSSNRIVATGSKYISSNFADGVEAMLVRYDTNGARDFGFNGGDPIRIRRPEMNSHSPSALAIDSQGNILIGESASKRDAGGAYLGSVAGLWRFTSEGTLDATWGGGWIADALLVDGQYASWRGLTLQTNGKLVAAGSSSWGAYYPVLIRYRQ